MGQARTRCGRWEISGKEKNRQNRGEGGGGCKSLQNQFQSRPNRERPPPSAGRCGRRIKKRPDKWSGHDGIDRFKPQQLAEKREKGGKNISFYAASRPQRGRRQETAHRAVFTRWKTNLKGFDVIKWESCGWKAPVGGRKHTHTYIYTREVCFSPLPSSWP